MDIEGKDKFEIIKVFNSELDRIRELESKDQIHNLSPISMSLIDSLISGFRDIARSTVAYKPNKGTAERLVVNREASAGRSG